MFIVNIILAVGVAAFATRVQAQSPAWGQCGGIGWAGATTCVSGYTCVVSSAYYSQCIPGTATPTTTPTSSTGSSTGTTTSTGPAPTGSQIRSDQDPTYHFYLQNSNGSAVLGPESSSGYFTIGSTISFPGTSGTTLYLNVDTSNSAVSYQPVNFGSTATTTDWGLEGDTIIETNPRQLNFLACATSDPTVYTVYLQTGNDSPSGQTCSLTSLHLDCLC